MRSGYNVPVGPGEETVGVDTSTPGLGGGGGREKQKVTFLDNSKGKLFI